MTSTGTSTGWTTLADVRTLLRRRWDGGQYLTAWAAAQPFEAVEVPLRGPAARELGERFDEIRAWSRDWFAAASRTEGFRLTTRTVGGRSIGANQLPARFIVDGGWDALWRVLGVTADVRRFVELRALTASGAGDPSAAVPGLVGWVQAHPMTVLKYEPAAWARILATVRWLAAERGRGRYLRQVPVPGVDTKFVEAHRALLADLLDGLLPPDAVNKAVPKSQFAQRYGFRSQPAYVRFRTLGSTPGQLPGVTELGVRVVDFETAAPDVGTVFVLENEITYLAFPDVPDAIAVFGGGYALTGVAALTWFAARRVCYWGDLDTHGFAILDRLRARAPRVESFLMDRATLLAHPDQWVREPGKNRGPLPHLTAAEAALYRDLVDDVYGPAVRLEQERVGFAYVDRALDRLLTAARLDGDCVGQSAVGVAGVPPVDMPYWQ